mmetsp:Transcript_62115/g.109375  ORF Transcript_62115/g.109375 Transcript_62115/m.109375 type:complete len:508 (-) Transcript_62115:389-1912(-)
MLQRAHRNALLRGIARGPVVLRLERSHNLCVTLGPQCATFQHGLVIKQTLLVNVQSSLDIVQRRADHVQTFKKVIIEQGLRLRGHFALISHRVERLIHRRDRADGGGALGAVNVGVSEQKLSRKIGFFDLVHVGDIHGALGFALGTAGTVVERATRNAHHRPVFDHLTANRPCTDEEHIELAELVLQFPSKHHDLSVVPTTQRRHLFGRQRGVMQRFDGIIVEPLLHGHKLAAACFEHFLAHDATQQRTNRRYLAAGTQRKAFDQLLFFLNLFRRKMECAICRSGEGFREAKGLLVHLIRMFHITRFGQVAVGLLKCFQRSKRHVHLSCAVNLGKVHHKLSRVLETLRVGFKRHRRRLFHLVDVSTTRIGGKRAAVNVQDERKKIFDFHHELSIVEFGHAGDFGESDDIPRGEVVTSLFEDSHHGTCVAGDAGNHRRERSLAVGIVHHKGWTKVAEDASEHTVGLASDHVHAVRVAVIRNLSSSSGGDIDQHHNLKVGSQGRQVQFI